MKLKPTVAILAMALAGPALAAYGPSHAGGCAAPAMSSHMSGNSVTSSGDYSNCWYNRIHVGGTAVLATAYTTLEDSGGNNTTESARDLKLNNLNLFLDATVSKDVSAHVNVAYGDNDFYNDLYQLTGNGGAGVSVSGPAAYSVNTVAVDEAFVTVEHLMDSDVYMKVGQMFTDFGSYSDPYTSTPSLTQVMVQSNHTAVAFGYADNGFYGSVYGYRGNLDGTTGNNGFNQFGAKVGFTGKASDFNYDLSGSWQNDVRSMYEAGARNNPGLKRYFMDNINDDSTFNDKRYVYNVHADVAFQDFDFNADFTDVDNDLNATADTAPRVFGIGAKYNFEMSSMKSDIHGRWESVTNGDNVMAYDNFFKVGLTTQIEKNVSAGVDYAYYDGVIGSVGAYSNGTSNQPNHLSSLVANVRVDI